MKLNNFIQNLSKLSVSHVRKASDLFAGPFTVFPSSPSSLGIKAASAALYVMKRGGWAPSLRLTRSRLARMSTQNRVANNIQ